MGIQNFPIPFPIGLRIEGVLADGCAWRSAKAEAKAFDLLLKARLPCGAGIEIPLFHELAIASAIFCNVAITVFGQYVLNFLFQWHIFTATSRPTSSFHRQKSERKKSHSFTQEPAKASYGLSRNSKMNCDVQQATQKGTPVKR